MSEQDLASETDEPDTQKQPSLWRNHDYVGWWTGNTISALGTGISTIAYPLLILFVTGSVARAGVIGSANLLGVLVSTLWGGALADRVSRRGILLIGPLVQAGVLGGVSVLVRSGHIEVPLLAVAALASGVASGFVLGASSPALRRIVPAEQLGAASGQEMGRDAAAQLFGTPLGGFMFSIARWLPFGADAVSFVFASLGALMIRKPLGPDRDAAAEKSSMIQDIGLGMRFVWRQPFLRFGVSVAALLNMTSMADELLLIALVRYRGGSPTDVGFVTATAVAGALVGAIFAAPIVARIRPRLVVYGTLWGFAISLPLVAVVPALWEIAFAVSVSQAPMNVAMQAYVMRIVPDRLTGRVLAVNRFGVYGLAWAGPLVAGLLATIFGVPGGVMALLIIAVPLAIAAHVTKSLSILDTPIAQVEEAAS